MFVIFRHFQPSLIFAVKVSGLPLEWSPVRSSPLVGSTRIEIADTLAYYGKELFTAVNGYVA